MKTTGPAIVQTKEIKSPTLPLMRRVRAPYRSGSLTLALALALLVGLALHLAADQLPNPTITGGANAFGQASPFLGAYSVNNLFDSNTGTEYASASRGACSPALNNNGTYVELDFGSAITFDRFLLITRNNTADSVLNNRLYVGNSATHSLADTILDFSTAGNNGAGIVQKFNAVSGRYVRWEVLSYSTSANLGGNQMYFLNAPANQVQLPAPTVINSATPHSAPYLASKAVDGRAGMNNDDGSYACQGLGAGMFIDFDFGAATTISGWDFLNRQVDVVTAYDMIFSSVSDFSTGSTTNSYTASTSGLAWNTVTLGSPIAARYVRLKASAYLNSPNTGVREIQFYGPLNTPPLIAQHPQGGTIGKGNYFPLFVTANGASGYQWRFNGAEIPGATGASLLFTSLDATNAGNYDVVVTNANGSVTSSVATVTVVAHGYVVTPLSATAATTYPGKDAVNLINGAGLNGLGPVLGQTHGNDASAAGMWHSSGGAVSDNTLTFDLGTTANLTGANIWQMNQLNLLGRGVQAFGIFVAASLSDPVTNFVGSFTLRQATGTTEEHCQYVPFAASGVRVVMFALSNSWSGAVNEYVGLAEVRFEGTAAPTITTEPVGGLAYAWASFTLNVAAVGDQNQYQWFKDNGLVPNATNTSLILSPVTSGSGGDYFVMVSNYLGVVTSTVASVIYTNPVDLADALFVHYTFDEMTGSAATDSSGRGNHGTLNNFPADDSMWVKGRMGGALEFSPSGANDLNYLLTGSALTFTNADLFTFAFWARANSTPLNNPRFAAPLAGTHWVLWKPGTGVGFWSAVPATTEPSQSVWHHFAVTYSRTAGTYAVYVDGLFNAAGSGGVRADSGSVPWIIGHSEALADNVDTFRGLLDDFRIYNRNLYPGEIKALYDLAGPPVPTLDTPPAGGLRLPGDSFSFTVGAGGQTPLSYQWWKETTLLTDATNSTLSLSNLVLGDSGSYWVVVTNFLGSVTSAPAVLIVTNPPVDIVSDLRLWYPITSADDTGLGIVDHTGNVNDGSLQGFAGDDSQWVAGRVEFGLSFLGNNGSNQVVLVSDQSVSYPPGSLDFAASPELTLAVWVKGPAAQEISAGLIAKGTGAGGEQYALDVEGGAFRFFVRSAAGAAAVAQSPVPPNSTWQHVVAVYSRAFSRMKLYVNGAEVASATPFAAGLLANSHDVSFGSRQQGNTDYNLNFGGVLDDVRIYGRALTPADVTALYYEAPAEAPAIVRQPAVTYVSVGETATVLAVAGGTVPLSYQWMKGASPISDATNTSLTLTNVQLADDADYTLVVTNATGSVTSAVAHVWVVPFLDLRAAVAVASSEFNSSYPAANAFDGLWSGTGPNTARWSSSGAFPLPHWIYVDLGQTYLIRRVFLDWDPAWGADYTLRYRSAAEGPTADPNDWHEAAALTGYAQNENGIDGADVIFDLMQGQLVTPGNTSSGLTASIQKGGIAARYLMVNATAVRPGYATISIWELRVDGVSDNRLSVEVMGNGDAKLTCPGIPYDSYALEWTHDLTPPVGWTSLLTNPASPAGLVLFTNTPSGGSDFYRTRYVP